MSVATELCSARVSRSRRFAGPKISRVAKTCCSSEETFGRVQQWGWSPAPSAEPQRGGDERDRLAQRKQILRLPQMRLAETQCGDPAGINRVRAEVSPNFPRQSKQDHDDGSAADPAAELDRRSPRCFRRVMERALISCGRPSVAFRRCRETRAERGK